MKYLFDRTVSLLGLLFLSPVFLVVAALVRIKMPDGSVIFRQQRIGRHGKPFTMYKFRTMTAKHSGSSVSVAGESRITPLGVVLRKYKLDELPELWNVLKGDMSFVGPRPDVPGYADKLQGEDRLILELRPGITGPASLKYRDEEELLATVAKALINNDVIKMDNGCSITSVQEYNDMVIFPDKVRINRYYLHHWSFLTDIQIIIATVLGKHIKYNEEEI